MRHKESARTRWRSAKFSAARTHATPTPPPRFEAHIRTNVYVKYARRANCLAGDARACRKKPWLRVHCTNLSGGDSLSLDIPPGVLTPKVGRWLSIFTVRDHTAITKLYTLCFCLLLSLYFRLLLSFFFHLTPRLFLFFALARYTFPFSSTLTFPFFSYVVFPRLSWKYILSLSSILQKRARRRRRPSTGWPPRSARYTKSREYTDHRALQSSYNCKIWIAHDSRRTLKKFLRFTFHYSWVDSLIMHTDSHYLRSGLLSLAEGKWRPPAARVTRARHPMLVVTSRTQPSAAECTRCHWPNNAMRSIRWMIHT